MVRMAAACTALLFALQAQTPQPSPGSSPGDEAFAAGNFRTAFAEYQHALRENPSDVNALRGAGTIELYGNDLSDARRDLTAAANAGDEQATKELADLALRTSPFDVAIAGSQAVNLVAADPVPIVQVLVNGKKANFFVNTAVGNTVLTDSFAKSLGFRTDTAATIRELRVGQVTASNITADVTHLSSSPGPFPMGGILGTRFLSHFLWTINYERRTMRLLPLSASRQHKAEFADADSTPMWLVGDHTIFARAHVNVAPTALFAIDTGGAGFGVQLTSASMYAAHIARAARFIVDVTLANTTAKNVAGMLLPDEQDAAFPFAAGGRIGHGYFRHLRVTFDFKAMRIYLQRSR
jgi:hypothetical protein